ncbi:hypothetical protein [Thalassotalea piscium]|nr:hypothetical protein [Thalassotalea piscium]
MKTFKTITTQELTTLVCDGCGLRATTEGDYEFQEFISIEHHCGYGSIHGDGKRIEIDLCQQCFADMCGGTLRITDNSNSITEDNENRAQSILKYSHTLDVICQSKTKARQLKESSDLRLAASDILSKNKIANKKELTVALKRVEQLWDTQFQSAEGIELHQLADLICAFEKKDWDSYFEEGPLADDDFMPDRLSVKSTSTLDENNTARGMLASIPINTEVDDESSRDSALADNALDETKQYLLESIANTMHKHPELRLGQLLINAINLQQPCPEIFHIEDNVLADTINQFSSTTEC